MVELKQKSLPVITEQIAKTIFRLESVCNSEGIGPDASSLLTILKESFPDLAEEYKYLYRFIDEDTNG